MNRNKNNSRPVDPYEEQYQRQLEQFSRMAGESGGEVDLNMGSIDDAFAGYEDSGSSYQSPQGNYQPQGSYQPQEKYPTQGDRPKNSGRPVSRQRPTAAPATRRTRPQEQPPVRESREVCRAPKKKAAPPKSKPGKKAVKKAKPVRREKQYNGEELQFGRHKDGEQTYEKSHPIRSFFKTVIILLLVMFIGLNALLYYYISLVEQRGRGERTFTGGSLNSSSVTNILLIGSDTRNADEFGRTDTMILLSVNKSKKTVTMTSFMRDMYVEIKGKNHNGEDVDLWDKLNSAYVYGGAELLMDTIEYNFDISVDDYVYVDFFSFIEIVDSIGGIEVNVTDEEAAGMEPPMREQNKYLGQAGSTDLLSHGGELNLNGNQALAYARLRYVGNADFRRTERQREVISKIIDKVKSSDPLTVNRFAKTVFSNLTTNMSRADMTLMAYKAVFSLNYEMKSLRLPAEGDYSYGMHGDQSTLDVDIDACRELLRQELYS